MFLIPRSDIFGPPPPPLSLIDKGCSASMTDLVLSVVGEATFTFEDVEVLCLTGVLFTEDCPADELFRLFLECLNTELRSKCCLRKGRSFPASNEVEVRFAAAVVVIVVVDV